MARAIETGDYALAYSLIRPTVDSETEFFRLRFANLIASKDWIGRDQALGFLSEISDPVIATRAAAVCLLSANSREQEANATSSE